jgi:hypothetical protein
VAAIGSNEDMMMRGRMRILKNRINCYVAMQCKITKNLNFTKITNAKKARLSAKNMHKKNLRLTSDASRRF